MQSVRACVRVSTSTPRPATSWFAHEQRHEHVHVDEVDVEEVKGVGFEAKKAEGRGRKGRESAKDCGEGERVCRDERREAGERREGEGE
eukprot:5169892-Pleurochrysis_carterae.AAC.2